MEDISSPDIEEGFNKKDLSVSQGLDVLLSCSFHCACVHVYVIERGKEI